MENTVELLGHYGSDEVITQNMLDLVKSIEDNPFKHTLDS